MKARTIRQSKTPPREAIWGTAKIGAHRFVVAITPEKEVCRVSYLRGRKAIDVVSFWQMEWPRTRFTKGTVPKNFVKAPLLMVGTPLQKDIWEEIMRVPKGKVASYGDIAARAGYPRAARAVGTACRQCTLAHIVPCQRIVAAHGLGGFGGDGLAFKIKLLKDEGVHYTLKRSRDKAPRSYKEKSFEDFLQQFGF